jgi:hypothetical protein
MLDLPGHSVIDKQTVVGGCVRLPLAVEIDRLVREYQALPASFWGTTSGRVGVHNAAEAVFLRGYAPAEGDKPIVDRPALDHLPYVRQLIEAVVPAPPLRCLFAKLPAGGSIAPHIDRAPYFSKTLRIHIPVESHESAWMMSSDKFYRMQPGEVWVLNNSDLHAVWNADATRSRTHMICDFLPTPELLALIAQGEKELASREPPSSLPWSAPRVLA